MCGRYTVTNPSDLLEELGVETTEPSYNVAPTRPRRCLWWLANGQ